MNRTLFLFFFYCVINLHQLVSMEESYRKVSADTGNVSQNSNRMPLPQINTVLPSVQPRGYYSFEGLSAPLVSTIPPYAPWGLPYCPQSPYSVPTHQISDDMHVPRMPSPAQPPLPAFQGTIMPSQQVSTSARRAEGVVTQNRPNDSNRRQPPQKKRRVAQTAKPQPQVTQATQNRPLQAAIVTENRAGPSLDLVYGGKVAKALIRDDLEFVKNRRDIDTYVSKSMGKKLIHLAARSGAEKIARYLCEIKKVLLNEADGRGESPSIMRLQLLFLLSPIISA